MVRESDLEIPKKRRKSVSGSSCSISPSISKESSDMYKTIITFEEEEANTRTSTEDSENFLSTCDVIRKAMSNIAKLKSRDDSNVKDEIRELQIQTALAFIELKKLNRMEKFRTKFARDALTSAKSKVDNRHLHLQNLLYEVMHLKKEVIKCLQFKSKDELIELVSVQEFFDEAPKTISRAASTENDPHQLRLARLEWELTQRKQLASLCDELSESKKSIALNIESKQLRLDNLTPELRSILDASKPLQDSLGLPLDKIHKEHEKAALLASPLYVLYAKATAYRDAYDSSLNVSVEGDEDEAKRINHQDGIQDSDSDQETQSESLPEEIPVHKKRHHRLSREAREEEKKLRFLQKHPLSVEIIIIVKNSTKLTLRFSYLTFLKVVTVESRLDTNEIGGITAGDILVSESVLRELYPKDTGLESPNPANHYQLSRHNLGSFPSLGLGTPYKWAQRMAGLHFITSDTPSVQTLSREELAQNSVESVLKEVKRRVKSRIDLYNEIRLLESGNFPFFTANIDPMPQKVAAALVKFNTMSWKNYSKNPNTPDICTTSFVLPTDIFYEAIIRRGSSEIIAYIAIKPDYPKVPPVFSISMNPTVPAAIDIIRDIEREINVMWERPTTLSNQLQRLRACFDIYLETEGIAPREKIFFHSVKGRMRARPYKFLALGGGIFTQR